MENNINVLVSIIVPCYNQAHFLDEALQSVFNQTYPNWECIIVNDGSPDNTEFKAKSWCDKDKRFVYVYKENGGLSSARNKGIKVSKGEFILPLDSDDILHEDFLKKTVAVLQNNASLAIVSCYSKFFSGDVSNIVYELRPKGNTVYNLLFENRLVATSLYRKKLWEEVGGYDEQMKKGFEDWEFWVSITKRGWKYEILEEFLFFYRKSKKSMLIDTLENHKESNMQYVFMKHKEFYIENYDNQIKYLLYLIKTAKLKDVNVKNSLEFKIGKILLKPYRILQKLLSK